MSQSNEYLPSVSVIMAIRNEADFIERSLGAVLAQDYPTHLMEVLVADGMSEDRSREIAMHSANQARFPVRLIENPARIVSSGLNAALKAAHGEIIVRVDGHTIVERDYVRQCVDVLQRSGADAVGGRQDPRGTGRTGCAIALATSCPFGVGNARFHYSEREEWVDTTYLGAWPREVFERFGLFDEELVRNQDDEFSYRLRSFGGRIRLSPNIKSVYHNRASLIALCRQYFQYGFWKVRVIQKHRKQSRPRHFAPAIFVGALMVSALLGCFFAWPRILFLGVIASYALSSLFASITAAARGGWGLLPFLPLAFATLHCAYGVGFYAGLVRYGHMWGTNPAVSDTRSRLGSVHRGA